MDQDSLKIQDPLVLLAIEQAINATQPDYVSAHKVLEKIRAHRLDIAQRAVDLSGRLPVSVSGIEIDANGKPSAVVCVARKTAPENAQGPQPSGAQGASHGPPAAFLGSS